MIHDQLLDNPSACLVFLQSNFSSLVGPWKFVPNMSSSNHLGLIIAPGQEAN